MPDRSSGDDMRAPLPAFWDIEWACSHFSGQDASRPSSRFPRIPVGPRSSVNSDILPDRDQ